MSLIHWWPLNNTQDRITNTQLTNNGATIVDNGKIGQCYTFNGSTNLTIPYSLLNTLGSNPAQFSFAFWIKLNSTWAGWGQVFTIGKNGGSWTDIRIGFDIANDKTGYFTISDGSATTSYNGPKHVLTIGKWYHIAATFDNKEMKLFVDGQPASTPQATASVLPSFSSDTIIAIGGNSSEKGECDMNDVRIYDHVLSQAEIKELSKALVMHYTFDDVCAEPTTNLLPSSLQNKYVENASDAASYTITSGLTASAYTLSANIKRHIGDQSPSPYISLNVTYSDGTRDSLSTYIAVDGYNIRGTADGQFHHYRLTILNPDKKAVTKVNGWILDRDTYTSGTPRYMTVQNAQLEAKDYATPYTPNTRGSMIYNETGLVPTTNLSNVALSANSATGNYSLKCNNSWVYNETSSNGQQFLTMAAWVNPTDYSGDGIIIGGAYLCINSSGKLYVYCYGRTPEQYFTGTTIIPTGQWTHIAVTWDDKDCTGYVNGVQEFKKSHPGIPNSSHHNKKDIGSEYGTRRFFNGLIDDVRVYNTCLSATDIQLLSSAKGMVSNKGDIEVNQLTEADGLAQVTKKYTLQGTTVSEGEDGYTFLEYIEATGSQYFSTGYTWNSENTMIVADINPIKINGENTLFGNEEYYSGGSRYFSHIIYKSGGKYYYYLGTGAGSSLTLTENKRQLFESFTRNAKAYLRIDGTMIEERSYGGYVQSGKYSNSTNNTKGHIYVFSNYNTGRGGAIQPVNNMRMYHFSMYDNDVLVRDIVPCKRLSDGAIGAYDLVTKTFLPNAGSGAFTAGPILTYGETAMINKNNNVSGRNLIEV